MVWFKRTGRENEHNSEQMRVIGKEGSGIRRTTRVKSKEAYLIAIHFKLADDFNRYFVMLSRRIFGTIDITEGAVAHLVRQDPALQSWVLRHFVSLASLLGDNLLDL